MGTIFTIEQLQQDLKENQQKYTDLKDDSALLSEVFRESLFKIDKLGNKSCDYSNVNWNRIRECDIIMRKHKVFLNNNWEKNDKNVETITDFFQHEENKRMHIAKLQEKLEEKMEKTEKIINKLINAINMQQKGNYNVNQHKYTNNYKVDNQIPLL